MDIYYLLPVAYVPTPRTYVSALAFFALFSGTGALANASVSSLILGAHNGIREVVGKMHAKAIFSTFPCTPS